MTEPHGLVPGATDQVDDAAGRGRLRIADRVVEKIACQAARATDGVAVVGSRLEQAVGRRYPRAEARIAGSRAHIVVEVAARWPIPLATTTSAVRAAVVHQVQSLAGLHVDVVDVHAARVVLDDGIQAEGRVR